VAAPRKTELLPKKKENEDAAAAGPVVEKEVPRQSIIPSVPNSPDRKT
jgi:hypothetical protein